MGILIVNVVDTQAVEEAVVLGKFIEAQKRNMDYMGHVMASHLGQISEDEMDAIDEAFAFEPRELDADQLALWLKTLLKYTRVDYTPQELANCFQVDGKLLGVVLDTLPEYSKGSIGHRP